MLAVHWSPVKNTKAILRNGIRKSRRGLFCFPLTGDHALDRWWAQAFKNWWRPRTQYNGFVFRIQEQDLPARFGPLLFDKPFDSLQELKADFRRTMALRIGEHRAQHTDEFAEFARIGEQMIREDPKLLARYQSNASFMRYVFLDYQITLSHSIMPNRIIRVLSASQLSGRARVRKHRHASRRTPNDRMRDLLST